jgi:hypothetical protein
MQISNGIKCAFEIWTGKDWWKKASKERNFPSISEDTLLNFMASPNLSVLRKLRDSGLTTLLLDF